MGMGFLQMQTGEPKCNTFETFQREPQSISFNAPQKQHQRREAFRKKPQLTPYLAPIKSQNEIEQQQQQQALRQQIEESRKVQANWDSYGALAPTSRTIDATLPFINLCFLIGLIPNDFGAMTEGGITISFMKNGKYGAVEFYNSGEIVALLSRPVDSDVWEFPSNILEFQKVIRQIEQFLG